MAESDKENGEGFASRWSRRKREIQLEDPTEPLAPAGPEQVPARPVVAAAGETAASPPDSQAPDLPDPDTLDADGDFTVFLGDNVPEALRRRALRRLWRLDPVLANLDGLNDYDDDFTDAAMVIEGMKTLYKVGKGFMEDEDENKADENQADEKPGEATQDGDGVADATPDEAPAELEPGHDVPGDETAERAQVSASPAAPPPTAQEVKQIAVSGPGNRKRGALARRWGKVDG